MIDEGLRDQAIDYVLGLLDGAELMEFESHLVTSDELRTIVEEYRACTALLALQAPAVTPPPSLRTSILETISAERRAAERFEESRQSSTPVPSPATIVRERQKRSPIPLALAAGFAILAGILWSNNQSLMNDSRDLSLQKSISEDLYRQISDLREEIDALKEERNAAERLLAEAKSKVPELEREIARLQMRNQIAEMQVATLTSQIDASYLASIAWDPDEQTGVLHVRRLPETESGKDYQLWVLDKSQSAPISAGIFRVQPDGSATIVFSPTQPVSPESSFAVSVERAGGAPAPEGPIILSN